MSLLAFCSKRRKLEWMMSELTHHNPSEVPVKHQDYTSSSHLESRIPKGWLGSRLYSLQVEELCFMGPHL